MRHRPSVRRHLVTLALASGLPVLVFALIMVVAFEHQKRAAGATRPGAERSAHACVVAFEHQQRALSWD